MYTIAIQALCKKNSGKWSLGWIAVLKRVLLQCLIRFRQKSSHDRQWGLLTPNLMGPCHPLKSISHRLCVQPMGLCCHCMSNVCIVGLCCPINFSTSLLLLQVVLRSSSPGHIFFSVCLSLLFSCHTTLAIQVCCHIKKLADAS